MLNPRAGILIYILFFWWAFRFETPSSNCFFLGDMLVVHKQIHKVGIPQTSCRYLTYCQEDIQSESRVNVKSSFYNKPTEKSFRNVSWGIHSAPMWGSHRHGNFQCLTPGLKGEYTSNHLLIKLFHRDHHEEFDDIAH